MAIMQVKTLQAIAITIISLSFFATLSHSLPLSTSSRQKVDGEHPSTSSRWIVDAKSGHRVKLTCVNWPGHMDAMVAEGLNKRPVKDIAAFIASVGFNCVRHTWATYMFTRANYTNLTVAQSLDRLNLTKPLAGITKHNPEFLNMTLVDAQKAVVRELGVHNIMVVLDNHVSFPKWCCGDNDGNGFFGDEFFDPNEWLQGLTSVAMHYKGNPTVVAMSMRNELRGPKQNKKDWFKYVRLGAKAIHKENPDVLVIVSGLSYDTDLSFMKGKSLGLKFQSKLVYEAHWYSFGDTVEHWVFQTNEFCANVTRSFIAKNAFVVGSPNPVPLFLSEFGVDYRGVNQRDNRFFTCALAFLAERDHDWALWSLPGSYMLRNGQVELEETYGVVDASWEHIRNPKIQERLQLIQQITLDPNSNNPTYYVMHHPQSGQCARVGEDNIHLSGDGVGHDNIYLSDCRKASRWSHIGDGSPIGLIGTSRCLKTVGEGFAVILSDDCSSRESMWERVSVSKLHVAVKDKSGRHFCLAWPSFNNAAILTEKCLCLDDNLKDSSKCIQNPQSQWFQLIATNKN